MDPNPRYRLDPNAVLRKSKRAERERAEREGGGKPGQKRPKQKLKIDPRVYKIAAAAGAVLLLIFAMMFVVDFLTHGTVSGQVKYAGRPVTGGWVTFRSENSSQNSVAAQIDADGRYQVTLPLGEVKISVDNRELAHLPTEHSLSGLKAPVTVKIPSAPKQGAAPGGQGTAPHGISGRYVLLPERFYNIRTSGLTYTVGWGSRTFDIELK